MTTNTAPIKNFFRLPPAPTGRPAFQATMIPRSPPVDVVCQTVYAPHLDLGGLYGDQFAGGCFCAISGGKLPWMRASDQQIGLSAAQYVLLFLLLQIMQWFFNYIRVNMMAEVGQSIIFDMRNRVFIHLQEAFAQLLQPLQRGPVITRVINDVGVLRDFVTWTLLAVARDLFTLAGIIITMLVMNWKLSLLTFTVLPVMAVVTFAFRKQARENYRRARMAISWVNSVLAENINAVRVVQSFSREDTNYDYFRDVVNRYNLNANLIAARLVAIFFPSVDLLGRWPWRWWSGWRDSHAG
jgi:ABC-type multidrug transport system fused ATPase/permease subunit